MKPAKPAILLALLALLAGCMDGSGAAAGIDPTEDSDYVSGRVIRLKMQVVDYDQTLYPGLDAWLWAFCVEPFDPADKVSADAIEYLPRLPGDGTNSASLEGGLRDKCGVPGPTIRVRQGDRVIVEFTNNHVHPHTIHWHGQYVEMDDDGAQGVSQKAVEKSESFTYDFIAKRAGTLWYHCHVDAGFHVMQGLHGLFIVEPRSDRHEPKDVGHEETMVLSTMRRVTVEAIPGASRHNHPPGCFISGTPDCENPPQVLEPDVFLINGHSYPLTEGHEPSMIHIGKDETVRLRILNAGTEIEEMHLHGHDMEVIAQDGVPLASHSFVDTLRIGPAERFDVLIRGTNPGVWLFHTHVATDETNDAQFPGGMHTMMVYKGYEDKVHAFRAEKPGGMPYMKPVFPPGDRTFFEAIHLGVSPVVPNAPPPASGVSEERLFRVEMACAAKSLEFSARLTGSAASLAATQLHVALRAPGATAAYKEADLGRDNANPTAPKREFAFTDAQVQRPDGSFALPQGNWTIAVTGAAAESVLSLSATVDYYGSWEEQLHSHHTSLTPLCGKYGYGNDGRPLGAPPV